MLLQGNEQDTWFPQDRRCGGGPDGPHLAPAPGTTPYIDRRAARSTQHRGAHDLDEETPMTNSTNPSDDDRTVALTTVANPKRVRIGSPSLSESSDRD